MLAHLDALGGHESLGTRVLGAKGNDDLLVAGDDDLEVGIRFERPGDALEHDLWRLVSAHGVNHNANHMRLHFRRHLCFRQDCAVTEKRPARQGPASLATLKLGSYSVTMTSRPL